MPFGSMTISFLPYLALNSDIAPNLPKALTENIGGDKTSEYVKPQTVAYYQA